MMKLETLFALKGRLALTQEQRAHLLQEFDQLSADIATREAAKPLFKEIKQQTEHNVTALYSDLLTSIVHDVMQSYDQRVELTTEVVRGKTALFLHTFKDGHKESVDDGRGGSIANLIAAGLRFISLIKSTNRRFIVLDEAECWLEPQLIPRFVHVIERLCEQIGMQCLMISHHASDVLGSDASRIITLRRDNKGPITAHVNRRSNLSSVLSDDASFASGVDTIDDYVEITKQWDMGIKRITLCNVQSHNLTDIELGPGLTVLTGANDIGKSAIARVLKALISNTFKDELITHEQEQSSVTLHIEAGLQLTWKFLRKGKVSLYSLTDANGLVLNEEEAATGISPEFIHDVLAMKPMHSGIDTHIADQKDPLFILHPSISPSRRAEMLNLGDEFARLQKMLSIHDVELKDKKRQLKRCTEQVNIYNDEIARMSPIHLISQIMDSIPNDIEEVIPYEVIAYGLIEHVTPDYTEALSLLGAINLPDAEPEYPEIEQGMLADCEEEPPILSLLHSILTNTQKLPLLDTHESVLSDIHLNNTSKDTGHILVDVESLLSKSESLKPLTIDAEVDAIGQLHNELLQLQGVLDIAQAAFDAHNHDNTRCPACGQAISSDSLNHAHASSIGARSNKEQLC